MTYVVTEACIKCKYMDCVEVCPVDCFYEGANMLVIHPDECILPDSEGDLDQWLTLNAEYAEKWPNITRKGESPADAEEFKGVAGKFEKHFSAEPGTSAE